MLLGSHRLFGIVLYLGLLGGGVLFVKQTVIEFMKGATSYTEENKQVTLQDLPTILICLDFERDDEYFHENLSVNLLENQDIQTSIGIDICLSKMTVTRKGEWE